MSLWLTKQYAHTSSSGKPQIHWLSQEESGRESPSTLKMSKLRTVHIALSWTWGPQVRTLRVPVGWNGTETCLPPVWCQSSGGSPVQVVDKKPHSHVPSDMGMGLNLRCPVPVYLSSWPYRTNAYMHSCFSLQERALVCRGEQWDGSIICFQLVIFRDSLIMFWLTENFSRN